LPGQFDAWRKALRSYCLTTGAKRSVTDLVLGAKRTRLFGCLAQSAQDFLVAWHKVRKTFWVAWRKARKTFWFVAQQTFVCCTIGAISGINSLIVSAKVALFARFKHATLLLS